MPNLLNFLMGEPWSPYLFCFALALLVAIFLKLRKGKRRFVSSFIPKSQLMTPTENAFFKILQEALGKDFEIFSKIRIGHIIRPIKGLSKSAWYKHNNKIARKHVDFILYCPDQKRIMAVLELDDSSHERDQAKIRDEFVNHAFKSAGIYMMRFTPGKHNTPESVKKTIQYNFDNF